MTTPANAPRQLVLDLANRPALAAEDFLVSSSNAAAVAMIDRWPDWPQQSVVVVGPARSGKSHLANVWRLKSGADAALAAETLDLSAVQALRSGKALVIEDVHRGVADQKALFHLLNIAREHRSHLLLTSARAPGELDIALPDLRSRLRALPVVSIEKPDADLLRAVLVKLFNDRQLIVEPHVIGHVALHMEQSMAAAVQLVDEIDRRALAAHRKVTRALAAEVLAGVQSADHTPSD